MENFDIETPDIPLPDEAAEIQEIVDAKPVAFKFAFVGVGQAGGRLAESFLSMGYRRVAVLNTAEQDLAALTVPAKMCFGSGGAGKNPAFAAQQFVSRQADIFDFLSTSLGPDFNRIILLASGGGGTGAGSVVPLVECARELQEARKCASKKVGVILALPKISEGKRPAANAYWVLSELADLVAKGTVSPLIVLDNEKLSSLYPKLDVESFWDRANASACRLFDLFNTIGVQPSSYTSFDPSDYATLLDSGIMVFGATPVPDWQNAAAVSSAIRDNLRRNMLSGGVDLSTGNVAAAIVVAGRSVLSKLPQENLDHAFAQLTRLLRAGSTVHRGIYSGSKESLAVYTAIGGLAKPTAKLEELKRMGDILMTDKMGVGMVLGERS